MNKILFPAMLLASAALFMACEDDRDDNPVISEATEFVLNSPAYAGETIDLASSSSLTLTWSQPNWGFPIAVNYAVQYSATGNFTVSTDEADLDETGATTPDYYAGSSTYSCSIAVDASEVASALESLYQWSESNVPETTNVYVRIFATPESETTQTNLCIASNILTLEVNPYYIELSNADVEIWYLVGSNIGDGSWNNVASAVGTSLVPLNIVSGYEYDAKTGQGEIAYTGYLTTDGFKLIKTPGSWDDQWGMSNGSYVKNDGGSSNIEVATAGYYTLTLNTATDQLTITALESEPKSYSQMLISGDFNSWGTDTEMTAVNTASGMVNHLWRYTIDASDGETTCKFLTDSTWGTNWGAEDFPMGFGVANGANIPVSQGVWTVIFNDIDGSYFFVEN